MSHSGCEETAIFVARADASEQLFEDKVINFSLRFPVLGPPRVVGGSAQSGHVRQ